MSDLLLVLKTLWDLFCFELVLEACFRDSWFTRLQRQGLHFTRLQIVFLLSLQVCTVEQVW